jgi:hypothetical protein
MGYSSRYHAASLAAVFLALAVGILIGVGFGSDIVNGTADDLENSLHSDLDDARAQVDDLQNQLDDERDFTAALTPAVVENRLRGRRIAIVALGALDDSLSDGIRDALEPAGAKLQEIAVVREPPDPSAATAPAGGPKHGTDRISALARAARLAGRSLVSGSGRFADLRAALFSRYSGEPGGIDGVVVVRQRPAGLRGREAEATDAVEDGLIDGLQAARPARPATVVGAEATTTDPSSIAFFTDRDVASVDNVDQPSGKVALVYALGGAAGAFGVKETADALLPDLLAPSEGRSRAGKRP